ncbi:serine/threonine-protein kinase [Archangium violaceum]|uniref:serine/threonine-protein kinase n=1 Tax=Archangium violaceum TaxID=83451 RepID=UPI001EF6043A|nr:serine/threonine-protein kinase [Archangium violaceum]
MNESRYRMVRPLATGGMAELFLGVARGAEGFEKPVAIKRILPHLASEPTIAKMFLAEARLATHLHHQNIASVYDVGSGPNGLFLVMELVNGWDLGVLLRHAARRVQRFPPHLVAHIGAQVLAGLIHAYRRMHAGQPVLTAHRDISPSNILVSREGEVKVTDFGIARLEGMSMGTQPGTFKGKLPYASPETLQGQPATALSDQFALGIVLYELLAGQHPFLTHDSQDPLAFAMAITQREPPPLTGTPAPLAAIVARAMSKAPQARFPRPEDMAEALARYLAQAGEPANSQSLAAFINDLNPPPTLLELGDTTDHLGELDTTTRHLTLATRPVESPSFDLQPSDDWTEQPGGAALSASGRLIQPPTAPARPREFRCSRCNAPLPSAHAPCDRCARELAPGLSMLAEDVSTPAPQQQYEATFAAPPRSVLDMPEEELQVAERVRPESDFPRIDEPGPRSGLGARWARSLATVAVLLLVLGGAVVAWPNLKPLLDQLRYKMAAGRPASTLFITSEPEGATVTIDGTVLGTTPLALDNSYPPQDIPVQVTHKGYKPWKGTFTGSQPASLDVKLLKR